MKSKEYEDRKKENKGNEMEKYLEEGNFGM